MPIEQNPQAQQQLPIHEWIAVAVIILTLSIFTIISILPLNQKAADDVALETSHRLINPLISVTIEGAVENPGQYSVERGSKIADLLQQANPTAEADLTHLKPHATIKKGQIIKIPQKETIVITVEGAVENPGSFRVQKGCRLCDLTALIKFQKNANMNDLKKKRKLKNEEVIHISSKN